jgi:NAD+ synthase (glutamine-hydrolysing)
LALCQLDPVVGDLEGNVARVLAALSQAEDAGADLAAFPELVITGYPPEDLLLKSAFVADSRAALDHVARRSGACAAVVGYVDLADPGADRPLANAVALCAQGRVVANTHKQRLPNYAVFDEARWFAPGLGAPELVEVAGVRVGLSVCEDLWSPDGPVGALAAGGAQVVVNVNASPFCIGRQEDRLQVIRQRVAESPCVIAYVNQVGGQDELVFDGGSLVVDATGNVLAEAVRFAEAVLLVDIEVPPSEETPDAPERLPVIRLSTAPRDPDPLDRLPRPTPLSAEGEVYSALVLGTRDYLAKNGFTDVVIGLSGGVDSSLVAVVAVDALGAGHVHGLSMPSRYSSEGSRSDAATLAETLGIDLWTLPIEAGHAALAETLTPILDGPPQGLADENLQSRLRGVLLMAVSNARGWIVLTTGNKSELATGYSTLYGDSAGGFAVLRDVPKTFVYRLCEYRNRCAGRALIPLSVLEKPPSAELRPDQRDDQSLPAYEVLDPILEALVEEDRSLADVVAAGYDPAVVARIARLVDGAEYKRRQSPFGVRITAKAFGKDRRMPVTNHYRDRFPENQAALETLDPDAPRVPAAVATPPGPPT